MATCANCTSDAVYEYSTGSLPVVFCATHLPRFLRARNLDELKIQEVVVEAPALGVAQGVIGEIIVTEPAPKQSKKKNSTSEEAVAEEPASEEAVAEEPVVDAPTE